MCLSTTTVTATAFSPPSSSDTLAFGIIPERVFLFDLQSDLSQMPTQLRQTHKQSGHLRKLTLYSLGNHRISRSNLNGKLPFFLV